MKKILLLLIVLAAAAHAQECTTDAECYDGNLCTVDHCYLPDGECDNTDIECNDNNACTADSCDPSSGCVYVDVDVDVFCNDNDPCTEHTCNKITGCTSKPKCPAEDVFPSQFCNAQTGECYTTTTIITAAEYVPGSSGSLAGIIILLAVPIFAYMVARKKD